jgi:hypothetical protein
VCQAPQKKKKKKKKKFCLPIQSPKRYNNMYMYLLTKETKKLDDDDDKHLGGVEKSRPKNQKVLLLSLHGSLTGGDKISTYEIQKSVRA